jgi:hypothetical protein
VARRTFFSFHYERDITRSVIVRNSWVTRDREASGFFDHSLWEATKKQGDLALKRLINGGLDNTSVTAVLVGTETYLRRWVRYEIVKSLERGNGLLGIYIHNIKDMTGYTAVKGPNPFDYLLYQLTNNGRTMNIFEPQNGRWVPQRDLPSISTANIPYRGLTVQGKLSTLFPTYNYSYEYIYRNIGSWIETAAIAAGR